MLAMKFEINRESATNKNMKIFFLKSKYFDISLIK